MATTGDCDILVIGGGPAGCTAAALLAEQGHDVVLLEKERHPRFHIGESLLPRNLAVFDRLGLRDRVAAIGTLKPGAEFVSDETGSSVSFNFATGIDREYTYSFQVPRADFDKLLFDNATAKGVHTAEATRVSEVTLGADGARSQVTVIGPDGVARTHTPRYVLDASGRDTFLAGRMQVKQANKRNNTAAVYGHFREVECRTGEMEGCITVHLAQDGWFWLIPLPGDIMSVGFVGTQTAFKGAGKDKEAFLLERIRRSRTVSARMRCAELVSAVTATGNYSYKCSSWGGDGYLLIGDAFAFIDPVFSSGVLLAMTSGESAAGVAHAWLADRQAGIRMAAAESRKIHRMMDALSWLIYRINTPELRSMFMNPSNKLRMRDGLVSVLAGNLDMLEKSRVPLLAFKGIYYAASALRRLGVKLPEDTQRKAA